MRYAFLAAAVAAGVLVGRACEASAQTSSLLGGRPEPMRLETHSFTYIEPLVPEQIGLHEILMVQISESAEVVSDSRFERRRRGLFEGELSETMDILPDNFQDAEVEGELRNELRTEGRMRQRDSLRTTIAVEVVDIRPNGMLVVAGHRTITNNDEVWDYYLSGLVSPVDILPNRSVMSERIAELRIDKRERGGIRDSTRRGWFVRLYDWLNPI